MSNNNYFIDGKIKLPYNFEKEKYIIGIEKKSDNTLVGSKTILPIKDALPNNKIEITPIFSPIFYFKYEENKFNVVENELKYNINLFIDETPVSMFELNDEDGLVVDWSDKYFIEKTGPRSFKLCLNDNYTSITDTNSVQYTELVNNGVFSESINIYIKYNDLYFNTKIDVLFSKSYFETTSLYDTIDVNSGVSENAISIEGYYNGTKVSKDNLSLKFKKENNSFATIISTLGYASLKQNKNEWILYCENSDKNPTEKNYTVDGNGNITTLNGTIVKYVQDDITGEFFDLSNGTKIFLKVENIDDTIVYYNSDKTVIPGINIFDSFNNIKINEATSYDSVNSVIKDTHDRVSEQKDGKYYPLDKIFKTTILNGGDKILYDKNGRLISTTSGSTLLLENGLILDGTNILSGSTVVISGNAILNNLNGTITKKNNNAFYYRGKLLYSGGTGYFNEEPVSNICPLITDDNGNVLYNVKKSANKIEIIGEKENYSLTFSNNKWIVNGPNRTFTANNIGELIYINVVIGDTNGNLYRRHDLNIHDFKNTHNILDGLTIKEVCGDEKEYKPITREEVYFDAHSINDIKKSIPNLYTYLNLYKGGNLPKINIITTCNGVLKDEKEFYLSNNKLNHSSYNIKIEPQVITPSMITNGGTVTAYVVNKNGEFIPFDTYSKNNYSLSYICDGSGVETKVTGNVCTINLTTGTPVYNDIKFILKCNDNIVKQEIIEVLGENKFITSVKYIDVTTGANYTIAPTEDFYGNKINWTTGNTSASTTLTQLKISAGDTVQKTLNGYVNGVKVHEQIVIPVKNGNDGESPYTLVLTNTNASINCDSEGNILNDIKMPTCKAILYKGTTEVTNVKYNINSVTGVRIETDGDLIFDTGFTFTGDSLEIVVSATTSSVLRGTAIMTITKTKQGPKGDPGSTGKGISSVIEYYQISTANTVTSLTNNWSTGVTSTDSVKRYLWNYEKTIYTDGSTGATAPVIIGTHGDTGKGISSVTEYYLVTSTTVGITTATGGWTTGVTTTDSVKRYLWNYEKTTYTDGSTGVTNPVIIGTHGETGGTGKGISSVTEYYLATSADTGIKIETDGWTLNVEKITPIKKYLWNYEEITYTDSSTGVTNPVIIGTYGDTGKGIINVTEYYQISSANTVTSLTNNWSTGITETDSINKYLWNYEKTTYTDGSTGVTNPVIIGTHGEKGDTGEKGESAVSYWMDITPNVIKKNGNNFSDTLIKISKWKQEGAYEPILMTGETVFVYHERREDPIAATTGTTYTISTGFNRNTLTFKWADGTGATDTVYDVQTIPIIKDGENGGKGDRGKLLYPAGRWNSGTTYDGTDNEKTPFVTYKVNNVDKYFVLTATTAIIGTNYAPTLRGWTEMAQYEALYTKLLVAENGLVGGSVYNGDYVFSKDGVLNGKNTSNYSGFTNSIVESVFTGDTPNNNFIPNYLVDFNKGRAWFGGGNTIINEKGIIYSKDIVDITHELPIPYPSGTTQNGWDRITTGITVENYISGGTKVYIKNIKNLNVFVYDDYESEVKTCPTGFIFLDVILPEDLFPIQNTWYNGSIIFSNTCPHTKLIRFPYSNVRDNLTTYKPYVQLFSYNCPFGLNVGEDGCLKYMYHPAKKIVEIIGSNHKVYETIKEKYEYDWLPSN